MHKPLPPKNANDTQETEKAPFLVVRRIREGILDEDFKPGEHLGEVDLAEKFEVSGLVDCLPVCQHHPSGNGDAAPDSENRVAPRLAGPTPRSAQGKVLLWMRPLDSLQAHPFGGISRSG